MAEYLVTFAAGASYGLTTVIVGQPLDTIKVRMQSMPSALRQNSMKVGRDLFMKEGLKGLYRGGLPLFLGGSLMRSAQFGVSGRTKYWLDENYDANKYKYKVVGLVDWQVIVSGIAGGLGRGFVEIPTDFFKIRRQVEHGWKWSSVLNGTAVTLGTNTVLYTAFMFYIDLSKQACKAGYVPSFLVANDQSGLTPFAKGAICANLAWLTCWPADVLKTQQQSGNYDKSKLGSILLDNLRNGRLFRGVVPGLLRSTIANGSSMVVYEYVHTSLTQHFQLQRRDMT